MKSLRKATFGQKFFLYLTYTAVVASFLGGLLAIGFGFTVGKVLIGIAVPVIVISGIISLLLFNLSRSSFQEDKED